MDQQTPNVAPQPAAPGGVQYAPNGARFLAALIDSAVMLGIFIVGFIVIFAIGWILGQISGILAGIVGFLLWLVVIAAMLGYGPYYEAGPKQATIGKSVMGIMVVDVEGRPITMGKAILRLLIKSLLGPISDIFILFDAQAQALHDKVAGTFVITGKVA